jgi:hypothetical protein
MSTGGSQRGRRKIKLVIFPGEGQNKAGTTVGHIYVVGGEDESYDSSSVSRTAASTFVRPIATR